MEEKKGKSYPTKTLSQRLREMPFSKIGKGKSFIITKTTKKNDRENQ